MGTIQQKKDRFGITRFYALVRLQGKRDTQAFDSKEQAQLWIDEKELSIRKGNGIGTTADIRRMKIGVIIDDFITKTSPNDGVVGRLELLKTSFGELPLDQLNTEFVHDWLILMKKSYPVKAHIKNGEKQPYADATIRRYYYELMKVLKWHSRIKEYDFNNRPFEHNPPPKGWGNVRSRIIEEDNGSGINELEALITECKKTCRKGNRVNLPQFLRWQNFSMMRSGETLKLQWKHLYFDENTPTNSYIVVPKSFQKTKEHETSHDRYIPLFPEFYDFVKKEIITRKTKPTDRIFPYWKDSTQLSKIFKRLRERTDLVDEDLKIHDLRHSSITSIYNNSSLSDNEIGAMSGHSQVETLARYRAVRIRKINEKLWKQ